MLNGSEIDTVLLDRDGTLLDLAFDRHFWLEHVPEELNQQRGIPRTAADAFIAEKYQAVAHRLNWYCLDYRAEALVLDIRAMTWAMRSRIALRDDTLLFCRPCATPEVHDSADQRASLQSGHHTGAEWFSAAP